MVETMGLALFNMSEYSELKMSDYYFSWGWGNGVKKIIPVGKFAKPVKKEKITLKIFECY